ncbi:MAG TPA: uracil-DNA glycosylase family protein [Trebonia sp.]|nr:uracil-DNA glycosylase family protein [Trebonia sp.]
MARAAGGCQGCDLFERASQTVFGEGAADADAVLVGEQPGDMEDRQGHPFVGPAGVAELAVVPTVHPSSVVRMQGSEREAAYRGLVENLKAAAALVKPPR